MNRLFLLITAALTLSCMVYTCKDIPPGPDNDKPDTTSHSFTWQTFTFGEGGGSSLHDVVIINDTLAYAVGEVYLKDSTGRTDPNAYNAARWDGKKWELKRVPFIGPCSAVLYPPLKAIWAFASDNILLTNGGSIATYDGTNAVMDCRMNALLNGAINRIFAKSPEEIYAVGNAGTIVYYSGGSWRKFESGTTLRIFDILGSWSKQMNRWEILAIASSTQSSENVLLQILPNNTVVSLNVNGLSSFSNGIWFVPQKRYYVVGSGIHQKASLGEATWDVYAPGEVTSYASSAIYGQSINDVFIAGSFLEVVHYNGSTWYNYKNEIPFADGVFADVDMKGNTVILVGQLNQQAIIMIGRR